MFANPRRPSFPFPAALAAGAVLSVLLAPAATAAQGLTLTASPSARWIDWDGDLAFGDTRLLGGALGIGFGRYVGLEAYHHEDDAVSLIDEHPSLSSVDVAQSGARVTLAFGTGRLVPVVGGGASLLRLRPDGLDRVRKLSFDYGVGFRAVLAERIQGEVVVEQTRFYLDPETLADPTLPATDALRRNLTLRAGLGIQLGRRSFDRASDLDDSFAQRYQAPFSGFALAIEPLVGRLDFDDATGLERQDMVGVRAGVDFGSFFGLRAFHWWGTESDLRTTNGMRAFGGEAQFNLGAGPGLTPYLSGGAARLTWSERGNGVQPAPRDQTAAVVGGGVDFNFGPRVRATLAARDYILTGSDLAATPDFESVADPDDLVHNWQVSAGLKFVVGGGGGLRPAAPTPIAAAPVDTLAPPAAEEPAPAPTPEAEVTTVAEAPTAVLAAASTPTEGRADTARVIVIPVPERGELYVRFGEPAVSGSLSRLLGGEEVAPAPGDTVAAARALEVERLRTIIREELQALPLDTVTTPPSADEERIRALEAKIDSLVLLLRAREAAEAARPPVAATPQPAVTIETEAPRIDRRPRETRLFSGFNTTGASQVVLGVGTDLGPLSNSWNFLNVVPSLALGVGNSKPSYLAQVALEFRSASLPMWRVDLEPMVSLGAGIYKRGDSEAVIPVFVGASVDFDGSEAHALDGLFFGLQGRDLFNGGRFLIGLRRGT